MIAYSTGGGFRHWEVFQIQSLATLSLNSTTLPYCSNTLQCINLRILGGYDLLHSFSMDLGDQLESFCHHYRPFHIPDQQQHIK